METRARYILVGVFTAVIIGAVFSFIYWLENAASIRDRDFYQVRFERPISGLLIGAAVSFNGIRVGEVTELRLNPEQPKEITAIVAVDPSTPIRADTRADIDYQGVTGVGAILLSGGSASAPPAPKQDGQLPVIMADPATGRNWTQAAGEVLGRIDNILIENADPLNTTLTGLGKFSEALGRNADKVDGILSGLEKLTGGGGAEARPPIYDIAAPRDFQPPDKEPSWQLVIPEPTALLALNTDKVMLQPKDGEIQMLDEARWGDSLSILFQEKFIQSFENAGYIRTVMRPTDGLEGDYKLLIDIRNFSVATGSKPVANAEFVARIVSRDGKVVAAREFTASADAGGEDAKAATAALSQAFAKSAEALIRWTIGAI